MVEPYWLSSEGDEIVNANVRNMFRCCIRLQVLHVSSPSVLNYMIPNNSLPYYSSISELKDLVELSLLKIWIWIVAAVTVVGIVRIHQQSRHLIIKSQWLQQRR